MYTEKIIDGCKGCIPKVFINAHLVKRIRVGYFDEKTKIWKKETPVQKLKTFLRRKSI